MENMDCELDLLITVRNDVPSSVCCNHVCQYYSFPKGLSIVIDSMLLVKPDPPLKPMGMNGSITTHDTPTINVPYFLLVQQGHIGHVLRYCGSLIRSSFCWFTRHPHGINWWIYSLIETTLNTFLTIYLLSIYNKFPQLLPPLVG